MIQLEISEQMADLILSDMQDHISFCNKGMRKWNKKEPMLFEAFNHSKINAQTLRKIIMEKLGRKI